MTTLRISAFLASALAVAGPTAASAQTNAMTTSGSETPPERQQVVGSENRSQVQDDERAHGLVRIGEDGIARANDDALDTYFAKGFVFHGPGGDMSYDQLKATFAAIRAAFSDFAVSREFIMVKGDMVSARTTMTGVFTGPFYAPPYGTIAPTGKPVMRELMNIFRYDAEGKLAEEWAQNDSLGILQQLGLVLQPSR